MMDQSNGNPFEETVSLKSNGTSTDGALKGTLDRVKSISKSFRHAVSKSPRSPKHTGPEGPHGQDREGTEPGSTCPPPPLSPSEYHFEIC